MTKARINYEHIPMNGQLAAFHIDIKVPKDVLNIKKLEKEIPRVMKQIAKDAKSFWDSEAAKRLKTSRVKYKESTNIEVLGDNTVMIVMEPFAGIIENAGGPKRGFDMKPGFLNSTKATRKFRIPRAFAATLPNRHAPIHAKIATKFIIIPLRWSVGGTRFRTVSDKSPAESWIWKPKKNSRLGPDGVKIREDVIREMSDNIIPNRMREMIEKVWGAS